MKRIILVSILSFAFFIDGYSQCKTCHDGQNFANENNHKVGKALPPDSSGGLAQSYILQNVCGLNWEQSSVLVETRSAADNFNTNGTGLPATIPITFDSCSNKDSLLKAFLYFNGSYQTPYVANPANVSITNPASQVYTYLADSIGTGPSKCWGETGTIAYRVDITNAIKGGGNYKVNLSGTGITAWAIDGTTMLIIYIDKSATYSGSIVLWDGLWTGESTTSQTFSGFNVCKATPTGQAFSVLADMQSNVGNGTNVETYNGSTGTFSNLFYNFCTVTTPLTAAQTSTTYSVYTNNGGDCYSWVLAGLYWQNTNCITCHPSVVGTLPISVSPPIDTICEGDSIQLTASGANTYIWNPPTGLSCNNCPNPMASPNATTTYSVTGFDGCTFGNDTVQVYVNPRGNLAITPASAQICPGAKVQLNVTGGNNYIWKPSISLSCNNCSNPIASPTVTTTYTVVSGKVGCTDSAMVTITIGAPVPFAFADEYTICEGSSTTITASGDSAYIWKPAASLSCSNCITTVASPTVTTTYTVVGIAPGGCTDSTTITISVLDNPTVTAVPQSPTICKGGSVRITASGASNYRWTPAATLSCSNCSNPLATPTVTTVYTVVGANGQCRDTITDTVFVIPGPIAVISPKSDSVCQGDSTTLSGSGGGTYRWSNGKTTTTIRVAPITTTTYTLSVSNGICADSTTVTVKITPKITAITGVTDSIVCPNQPTHLTMTTSGGQATYKWSTGETSSSITVTDSVTTTYTVTAYGLCNSVRKTIKVTVIPLAKPIVSGTTTKCKGQIDTLQVTNSVNPATYLWSDGKTTTTIVTGGIDADSTFYVTAFNSLGCPVTDTLHVNVIPYATATITYPPGCGANITTITANASGWELLRISGIREAHMIL